MYSVRENQNDRLGPSIYFTRLYIILVLRERETRFFWTLMCSLLADLLSHTIAPKVYLTAFFSSLIKLAEHI